MALGINLGFRMGGYHFRRLPESDKNRVGVVLAGEQCGTHEERTKMERIIFIDDDDSELARFSSIVSGAYVCELIKWPEDRERLFNAKAPIIFVSDLYLPGASGDSTPTPADRDVAKKKAKDVAASFSKLYDNPKQTNKAQLQATMRAIGEAHDLLELQWKALGQSPQNGIDLFKKVKSLHPTVPFAFYSRKITPEDVMAVLRVGAVDAIRKGAFKDEEREKKELLTRLAGARELFRKGSVELLRQNDFNVNSTIIP
ncbi:MAG TPA: hypothetical protein VJY15_18130 [Candidatus Acidoferrum sp.]|nr:hypothetical protein [Candidatus Acidoferrum sp.]